MNTTYETWLEAHRVELLKAWNGMTGLMPGEDPPKLSMSFQVFARGRYEQAQRGVRS